MSDCAHCLLHHNNLFCQLGPEALEVLESISTRVRFQRGAVFFREGDRCDSIYIVCSGRAKLSVTSSGGRVLILRVAEAGTALGLSAAISEGNHEVTAEATEPTELRIIKRVALLAFMERFQESGVQVARSLAEEYRNAFGGVCRLGLSSSPTGRLARLLLDWNEDSVRHVEMHGRIRMPYTHEELASMTGTSRETVTRTLGRFRKDNLIAVKGVSLTVLQPRALEHLCAS